VNRIALDVSDLLRGISAETEFREKREFSPLEEGGEKLEFKGPVEFNLVVRKVNSELMAEGTVAGKVMIECSRCLSKLILLLKTEVREIFRKPAGPGESPEEAFEIIGGEIDLGPLAEQAFLLALPLKPLCREDCKGLCPTCGKNLNEGDCGCREERIDPRLAILKKLKKK
jgi:uncharacterized protein